VNNHTFTVLYPFGGLGGGAVGQKHSLARLFGNEARFRVIGGIDFDQAACNDWHRPITTLECGALQGFLEYLTIEEFKLSGASHSGWRERIGNAVPPPAAKAIGDRILYTLLAAKLGVFSLEGDLGVWVEREREEAALQ
jgi:hypothetical protein